VRASDVDRECPCHDARRRWPSDYNGLHSRKHNDEVQLYAFDVLALEGEDLRPLPPHLRKANLARLLERRINGIFLSEFEQGEIGPDLFRHACLMGLEGLVSKHRDRALPRRPLVALDQGEEPNPPLFRPCQRTVFLMCPCAAF
jgi:hypothetical protein